MPPGWPQGGHRSEEPSAVGRKQQGGGGYVDWWRVAWGQKSTAIRGEGPVTVVPQPQAAVWRLVHEAVGVRTMEGLKASEGILALSHRPGAREGS
jgi:hypothetical protein